MNINNNKTKLTKKAKTIIGLVALGGILSALLNWPHDLAKRTTTTTVSPTSIYDKETSSYQSTTTPRNQLLNNEKVIIACNN